MSETVMPGKVTQRLQSDVAFDDVHPIARLQSAHQRQNFVRGKVEGMRRKRRFYLASRP
jgi:hypothetical protein